MKLIAHRGLIAGPDSNLENSPDQITRALTAGYDCEVDLRVIDGKLYLGHDQADYEIPESFLKQSGLWIHCKNVAALDFCHDDINLNYFWHNTDDYTLTSRGYVWAYPGRELTKWSIMVMPEWEDPTLTNTINVNCFGICSDYVSKL